MKNMLLPYRWKLVGWLLVLSGIVLAILYFWFEIRFTMPVFAVFSSYLENKFFVTFPTNVTDDLILLLLISGFGFVMFSKEKTESENLDLIRASALAKASIANIVFLLLSLFFIYGNGFIAIMVINLFSVSLFYLFFFYFLIHNKSISLKNRNNITL